MDLDHIVENIKDLAIETIEHGQREKVVVSFSESPSKLWIQLDSKKSQLDALLNTMFEYYSSVTEDKLKVQEVKEGQLVAAVSEDESWYRGKVVVSEGNNVTVMFVDYGNTEVVEVECLRKVPSDFCKLSVQVSSYFNCSESFILCSVNSGY